MHEQVYLGNSSIVRLICNNWTHPQKEHSVKNCIRRKSPRETIFPIISHNETIYTTCYISQSPQ